MEYNWIAFPFVSDLMDNRAQIIWDLDGGTGWTPVSSVIGENRPGQTFCRASNLHQFQLQPLPQPSVSDKCVSIALPAPYTHSKSAFLQGVWFFNEDANNDYG